MTQNRRNTLEDFFAQVEGKPVEGEPKEIDLSEIDSFDDLEGFDFEDFDFDELDHSKKEVKGDPLGVTEDGEVRVVRPGDNPDEFEGFMQDVSPIRKA